MSSYLDFEGVYDQTKRYMVFNWSPESFTQHFGQEAPYNDTNVVVTRPAYDLTIAAGEMRELGQFEAYTITKHFVNREIMREALKEKDQKARERIEMSMGNKDIRKPFEDKTLQEIIAGQETSFMKDLRDKIRNEELNKIKNEKKESKPVTNIPKEKSKIEAKTAEFAGV